MRKILKRAQEDVEQTDSALSGDAVSIKLRMMPDRAVPSLATDRFQGIDVGGPSLRERQATNPAARVTTTTPAVCCGVELQDVLEMSRQQVRLKQALTHLCLERCERRTTTPYAP